jgi:hypothetical protein
MANGHSGRQRGAHRATGILTRLGHTQGGQDQHHAAPDHQDGYTAKTADPTEIRQRLLIARSDLTRIARLTDHQLDTIPPKESFRFCDGQRTLEQVLAGLLNHQASQVQALRIALA